MKKVLVVGGSHAELPLIKSLKKMGYYVLTTGNNTDGIGHKEADEYIQGDFSDKEFVLSIAKQNGIEGIVSGCNDFAYFSSAYVCEEMRLPGHDSVEVTKIIHHKDAFRGELNKLGIRTPKVAICRPEDDAKELLSGFKAPFMIKAVDLTGGKGIRKCSNDEEAYEAIKESFSRTRENRVIIEEFIEGSNHGFTCLLKNQKVVFSFLDNEQYYTNPYLVSGACGPSDRDDVKEKLISDINILAKELHLVDGLFHVQIIIDKNGYPVMIDPCRRAPGDLYIKLVEYSTGVDYPMEIVKAELGLEIDDSYESDVSYISRECVMSQQSGVFNDIKIDASVAGKVIDKLIWSKPGDVFDNPLIDKAGIVFMRHDSYEDMMKCVNAYYDLVKIDFK